MTSLEIFDVVVFLFFICSCVFVVFLIFLNDRKRQREYDRFREELLDNLGSIASSLISLSINYYKSEKKFIDDYNHKMKEEMLNGR